MSSRLPMEKPKASDEWGYILVTWLDLGSAGALADVSKTLKLTVDGVDQGKHINHISSMPHRCHPSHPEPQTPLGEVYRKTF
jgi:hypothetical protein